MNEIHKCVCSSHAGGKSFSSQGSENGLLLARNVARSVEVVRKCKKCQQFAYVPSIPPEELTPISLPRPFTQWGVDIIGLLPTGKGVVKFAIVAVDYFTKWAEAEALTSITTQNVTRFLWKSIITRFGIQHAFVTDNGK